MFIPLGDNNSDRTRFPFVNIAIIIANILVFVFLQDWGVNEHFTYAFSLVPQEILKGRDIASIVPISDAHTGAILGIIKLERTPIPVYFTFFTAMFMHASLAHIVGNMLYLWIFGDNVENRLGHLKYFLFYLFAGVVSSLSHIFFNARSSIPMLGASGAIAGVLGAYLAFFPRQSISVLIWGRLAQVPAIVVLGFWFVFQVIESGAGGPAAGAGIAYSAHIGGFIAGFLMAKCVS
jgi:membrane associated rhomboid family serine protease